MSTTTISLFTETSKPFAVQVITARDITSEVRRAWTNWRNTNKALWSPCFDIRVFDILAHLAPHAHLAIAYDGGEIKALMPFQGKKGSLARPLGTPLSDQHNIICAPDCQIDPADFIAKMGQSGFVYSGLLQPLSGALKSEMSICHVADLSDGLDAYIAWRKRNWNDQVKKNERRKRQGERQWGPMRLETACPASSHHFETLMALKQAKYIETNKHNVLAVPWIKAYLWELYNSTDPSFAGEITLLYFGDHLAAMEFGLRADQAMHSWFPTFDRNFAQVSPGILLMDGMIEACGARGVTKVDLGIGHDQYKRHASNAPTAVWSGTFPVAPVRRTMSRAFISFDAWLQSTLPGNGAQLLAKFQRRNEMILAAEPTIQGRLRGYVSALKALG
jgi:CelD/BcsL family acetyltransferase involved in cellulose biosynthesis